LFSTGSFYTRESQSSLGLKIARANPVFGVALEGVTPYVHGYDAARHPNDVIALNNQAVELLAETGVVGTILFYVFLVSLVVVAWRVYPGMKSAELRALLLGSLTALIAMTLQAQSFTGFFLVPYWVVYGLVMSGITLGRKKTAAGR
jgi:O-antigen ligase